MPSLPDISHLLGRRHLRRSLARLSRESSLTLFSQVYNASFDDALAQPAKIHLAQCMNALKEMEVSCLLLHPPSSLADASSPNSSSGDPLSANGSFCTVSSTFATPS
jgi:hypothetical protein